MGLRVSQKSALPTTIMVIIFGDFLMFHQIFLSPQMKRSAIIYNKQAIYEFPHEMQKVLRV